MCKHLEKKGKSLKTTWSDNESDDSEEDDNNVRNYVVFHATTERDRKAHV